MKLTRYDLFSLSLILLISLFRVASFGNHPLFIDGYFHLANANGLLRAGGWVGWDFWSAIPLGRPNLYPPLYHLILAELVKLGLSGLNALRVTEVLICPLFFGLFWQVSRRLVNPRFGLLVVSVLSSFFPFYSCVSANLPASLAVIFGLVSWLMFVEKRQLTAALFLGLIFYTHSGMALIFTGSYFAVIMLNQFRLLALRVLGLSFVLAAPMIFYQARYWHYLNLINVKEAGFVHFSLATLVLFFLALLKLRNYARLPLLFFLGFFVFSLLVFIRYPYRLFSGQGLIGMVLLAAFWLDSYLSQLTMPRAKNIFGFILMVFLLFNPSFGFEDNQPHFDWINSSYSGFLTGNTDTMFEYQSFYYPKFYDPAIDLIHQHTKFSDVLASNVSIHSQMFAALTNRFSVNSLLGEIRGGLDIIDLSLARIIVWVKLPEISMQPLRDLAAEKIYENEVVSVWFNPKAVSNVKVIKAVIPFVLIRLIFIIFISLVVVEYIFSRQHLAYVKT